MLCAACITPALAAGPAIAWERLLGGSGSDDGSSVQETNDGGSILVGTSGSTDGDLAPASSSGPFDLWVVKMNAAGTIQWQKVLGGSDDDSGVSVQQTADGGYIIAASSESSQSGDVTGINHGGSDVWIVKLDGAGAIQWQRLLGGTSDDDPTAIRQTGDGGYILVADTRSSASGDVTGTNRGDCDFWAVRLSSAGQIQWQHLFGGDWTDWAHDAQQTADGGYILVGETASSLSGDVAAENRGLMDLWAIKLDGVGRVQWQRRLGGDDSDSGRSVEQTADGGYILLGGSGSSRSGDVTETNHGAGSDFWVVKLDGSGTIQWQKLLGGDAHDVGHSVRQTADGGYFLVGESRSNISGDISEQNHGFFDIWAVRLSGTGAIQWQKVLGGSRDDRGYSGFETEGGGYIVLGYSKSSDGDVSTKVHGEPDLYGVYPSDLWMVKLDGDGGSGPPTTPTTPSAALPAVTEISPSIASPGETVETATVSGTNFVPGTEVAIMSEGGGGRTNVFATGETTVNAGEIRCSLAVPDSAEPEFYYVFVRNPGAGWFFKAKAFRVF